MSELKVYSQCYDGTDGLFYLKSEADKVIAEKDKLIAELKEIDSKNRSAYYKDLAMMAKDVRHHKYKRCLNNASKFLWKRNYWRDSTPAYERQHKWENMAYKHYKRWLELAKKFKEAK